MLEALQMSAQREMLAQLEMSAQVGWCPSRYHQMRRGRDAKCLLHLVLVGTGGRQKRDLLKAG